MVSAKSIQMWFSCMISETSKNNIGFPFISNVRVVARMYYWCHEPYVIRKRLKKWKCFVRIKNCRIFVSYFQFQKLSRLNVCRVRNIGYAIYTGNEPVRLSTQITSFFVH